MVMPGEVEYGGESVWLVLAASPLENMDAPTRSFVLSALLLLTLLGAALILIAWLAARAARHYMNSPSRTVASSRPSLPEDDWASKPIVPREDSSSDAGTDDT